MEATSRQDVPFLGRHGLNFASFFDHLNDEQPDVREALEEHLREAISGFRRFRFQRIGQDAKLLLATLGDGDLKGEFNLLELSEGQRILILLYAAVLAHRSGSLLCFDEPDNFVSLTEIQPWLQLLRDTLDERGGQALVISHHPEVMDYMAVDEIWRFERPAGPVIARPYEANGAADLTLSELIARGA
jgi:predicted ATPase